MAIFLLILKIIGWILLGILAVVVLALFIRVRIIADYDEQSSLLVQWLFLKIPLYPRPPKKKKEADAQAPAEDTASPEAPSPEPVQEEAPPPAEEAAPAAAEAAEAAPKMGISELLKMFYASNGGVDGLILLLKQVFSYLGSFLGGALRAFIIDELQIDMIVTKGDAASTAIHYGKVCSTVFPMLGAFVTKYRVRHYDFNINPDFLARKNSASMHLAMHFRPATLIGVVLLLVLRLVFRVGLKVVLKMLRPVLAARKENKKNITNIEEKSGATNE